MILVDVNVLVYVVDDGSAHHEKARSWWRTACDEGTIIGFAWMAIIGFLRLSTGPTAFRQPLTTRQAAAQMTTWLELPNVRLVPELDDHWSRLCGLLAETGRGGNLVPDMHLAALAAARGAAVASFDRDFGQFSSLPWIHPGRALR